MSIIAAHTRIKRHKTSFWSTFYSKKCIGNFMDSIAFENWYEFILCPKLNKYYENMNLVYKNSFCKLHIYSLRFMMYA